MTREQMIAWLTLEGVELLRHINNMWVATNGDREMLLMTNNEEDFWSSSPRTPSVNEHPVSWDELDDVRIRELVEYIQELKGDQK